MSPKSYVEFSSMTGARAPKTREEVVRLFLTPIAGEIASRTDVEPFGA